MRRNWWKEGVIYQIYPRSFFDSDGDGIGDLKGIIQKIDHIHKLGIDIIWLSPIYKSPNDDNGYDISDYYDIMDEFGKMTDFDVLLNEIHKRGMRLLMDLVVNHTSDEHKWFQESRKSKDNPYRDYYIWRPPVNGGPPNNWPSFFGGNAWEFDEETGEYYLHLFTRKQPDLNWENEKVREDVYQLMRFWLDKGIDGFRMDVIPLISKRLEFEDTNLEEFSEIIHKVYANGPRVHEFLKEMNREVLSKYDMVSIGEGVGISPEQANLYVGESRGELDMIFHFGHMFIDHGVNGRMDPKPYSLKEFFEIFENWDKALGNEGWGSIYLGNHDFPRMVSRFGDAENYWKESAKLLATLLFSLKGTPSIYQGDEIGMTNVDFQKIEEYRDVELLNAYREIQDSGRNKQAFLKTAQKQARDHARTPLQWAPLPHGGFTTGNPWIRANSNWKNINVAQQEADPTSILNYYKEIIQLRKMYPTLVYGDFEPIRIENPNVYIFDRKLEGETIRVILNFSSETHICTESILSGKLLLCNYSTDETMGRLRAWEARVLEFSQQ